MRHMTRHYLKYEFNHDCAVCCATMCCLASILAVLALTVFGKFGVNVGLGGFFFVIGILCTMVVFSSGVGWVCGWLFCKRYVEV